LRERPRLKSALEAQQRIFEDQRDSIDKQVDVWKRRKDQFYSQIESTQAHMSSLQAQQPLLEEEMRDAKAMLTKGYGLKPRVLGLERQVEGIKGDVATDKSKISALMDQVAESDAQILTITSAQSRQLAEEMQDVQAKTADTQDQLRKSVARLGRREVVAPVDGVIMNVRSFTTGGVVNPGGALLDIVPIGEKLVVEVRLQPTDIDVVRPDLPASVRLVAYKQRTTPTLDGKVIRISPDAATDERTGAAYFVATVEVGADQLARVPHVRLYPGMPVEVAIITGQRSLLAYLMQPLTDSMSHAFRED
jgi:HlyD family type I secretion membrane fusion protein